jgi:hypothetical protein
MIDFFPQDHKQVSDQERFGICDTPPPPARKAYIDHENKQNWIAVVDNSCQYAITFIPVDNCIDIKKPDGTMDKRCDGFLYYGVTIIFVELKQRKDKGSNWIKEGEKQLRATIDHFEKTTRAREFSVKRAYIANSKKPHFKSSQAVRMNQFLTDTGYSLRIENEIKITHSAEA